MLERRVKGRQGRLIEAARSGDASACQELIHGNYARVYSFLAHLTGDAHLAEDLTQETFAAAWRGISTFAGRAKFSTWLCSIAWRKFVDSKRGNRLHTESFAEFAVSAGGPGPLEIAVGNETTARLWRATRMLEDAERIVIVLHYFQGMSLRETAEVLDAPLGTVKWRTNRALGMLRGFLNNGGEHGRQPNH